MKAIRRVRFDPERRPFMVFWEITKACDLACRHCRAVSQPDRDRYELRDGEVDRLLDELAPVRPLLILTGGDCFKREDLESIIAGAVARHIPVGISPSVTSLLTRDRLASIFNAGVRTLSLSLDGATPATHDGFRQVPGVFERTLEAWAWAREIGFKIQINTTVHRGNLEELPELAWQVDQRGAMTWSLFFLVPTGRAGEMADLTADEYEDVMHWLYDLSHWLSLKTTEGHHYKRVVLQRLQWEQEGVDWRTRIRPGDLYQRLRQAWEVRIGARPPRDKMIRPPLHLNVGNGILFIDHRGNVYPGGFLPIPCGNVRETSILEIYRNHPLFRRLRRPETWEGRCAVCEFRHVCGGSRSRAYAIHGSPFADDPRCRYQPQVERVPAAPG